MSEFKPLELGSARRLGDGRPNDAGEPAASEPPTSREGLPSSYRMRADPHYVDVLTSQTSRAERAPSGALRRGRRVTDEPGSDQAAAPSDSARPDSRVERLLAELLADLATIGSAAALVSSDPAPMARRVGTDLILAQAWRASWALRAHALLAGTHRASVEPRDIGMMLAQVRDGFAAECRLNGLALAFHAPGWNTLVSADESAFVTGVSGAVLWTLGTAGQSEGTEILVTVDGGDDRAATLEVSYAPAGRMGQSKAGRSRGASAPSAADEWTTTLAASATKAAARLHGGEAVFLSGDGRGSTVRLTVPRVP